MLSRDFNCFKGLLGRRQAARPGFGGDLKVACREKRAENVSESVSGVEFWGFLTADIASWPRSFQGCRQPRDLKPVGGAKVGKPRSSV